MIEKFKIDKLFNGQPANLSHPIVVTLRIQSSNCIVKIEAPFHNDPPPTSPPGRLWKLWEHEVVELFLVDEEGHYIEAEFGPHGHYLLLHLTGPREIADSDLTMSYTSQIIDGTWIGRAEFDISILDRIDRVNCFAIYGVNRRYLGLSGSAREFNLTSISLSLFKQLTCTPT